MESRKKGQSTSQKYFKNFHISTQQLFQKLRETVTNGNHINQELKRQPNKLKWLLFTLWNSLTLVKPPIQTNAQQVMRYFLNTQLSPIQQLDFQNNVVCMEGDQEQECPFKLQFNSMILLSVHLESGKSIKDLAQAMTVRHIQINEIVQKERNKLNKKQIDVSIIGGDFNAPLQLGSTLCPLIFYGFKNAFNDIPFWKRGTAPDEELAKYGLNTLDYIYVKSATTKITYSNPVICQDKVVKCKVSYDHLPVWVTLNF